MTIPLETRELARRLLIYEAEESKSSAPEMPPILRVYEKLRQTFSALAGIAGFHSLASRALALARSEDLSLSEARVTEGGALHGLGQIQSQIGSDNGAGGDPPSEAGIVLIARFLGLLHMLLGEALTASLLRVTWPGAALDNFDSENGRETREHTR